MAKLNTVFEPRRNWPTVASKRLLTNAPLIGWEWEIPIVRHSVSTITLVPEATTVSFDGHERTIETDLNMPGLLGQQDSGMRDTFLSRDWWKSVGFKAYMDSGGMELGSPIYQTIGDAKEGAAWVTELQEAMPFLDGSRGNYQSHHNCGIHVSVSPRTGTVSANQIGICMAMLNRESSAETLKRLAGRHDDESQGSYVYQSTSSEWDRNISPTTNIASRSYSNEAHDYYGKFGFLQANGMFRRNNHGSKWVMEMRCFGSRADRLPIAIEFAHALFKWSKRYNPDDIRILGDIPTMRDFKDYIDRCRGYNQLKAEPAWSALA